MPSHDTSDLMLHPSSPANACVFCDVAVGNTGFCSRLTCPDGAKRHGQALGLSQADTVALFRAACRRERAKDRKHFDEEAARDTCADAARALQPDPERDTTSSAAARYARVIAAVREISGDDRRQFANARSWIGLSTAFPIAGLPDLTIRETLWYASVFAVALPCPLAPAGASCSTQCEACFGDGTLLEGCGHCATYITIISERLADGGWIRPARGAPAAWYAVGTEAE